MQVEIMRGWLNSYETAQLPMKPGYLSTIRLSYTEETIKRMGNDCMKVAYEEVTNIMENEKINFHTTMRKCLELNKSKKTEEATIEMVRIKVSKKVFHARANVVFARYSANHVGRYANKDSGMALRQELKATCGTSKRKESEGDKITECSKKKKKAVTPTVQSQVARVLKL